MEKEPLRHRPGFNPWQYKYLRRCAEVKDMTRWNQWREKHPDVEILLESADFETGFQKGAFFEFANLKHANLISAKLRYADLWGTNLQHAKLWYAFMQHSRLPISKLQDAQFFSTQLNHAKLWNTMIEHTSFIDSQLQYADFRNSYTNNKTEIINCTISKHTDVRNVDIDTCRIDPSSKALLKCNIRRKNWEEWYRKQKCLIKLPVWLFWELSDYGKSPVRLIGTFFILSFLFAVIYFLWGWWAPPGVVTSLYENQYFVNPSFLSFIRAWYFSIVTTTTLGFGDMYAQPSSITGHFLLSMQVIIGYVILGALITYLGILYNSDGPAGKYADEVHWSRWVEHYAKRSRHGIWHIIRRLFRR